MTEAFHWTCPYCNHDATLRDHDFDSGGRNFTIQDPIDGHKRMFWVYIVCPNPKCKKYTLSVGVLKISANKITGNWDAGEIEKRWELIPPSKAKGFPDFIPKSVLDDYNEACLIVNQSPKASATLSRRCLQGVIRDFWKVKPGKLVEEIDQIKDKTDALTWDAIDSVRKVGNIGAHMEEDINLIIDVDPNEAEMLIGLIEMLLKDWYLTREERKNKLLQIKSIATKKEEDKKEPKN